MTRYEKLIRVAAVIALLPLGACDLLEVDAPGRIADDDLNDPSAFGGLVVGMAYDLATGLDAANQEVILASGELWHGGSYDFADIPRGTILPEDVNGMWGSMQQARWVAEDGLRRMEAALTPEEFNSSALVAEASFYAGIANRMLGENVCSTAIDGGPEEDHAVHFERAAGYFDQAIAAGNASGADDYVTGGYAGRASVKAWMGDWAGAVSDAQQVPIDFQLDADFTNEVANDLRYETYNRYEFSVWGTEFEPHPDDTRASWQIVYNNDGTIANGANGATPMYQQTKYPTLDSDVPLVKGTEMLILRAEAALRSNDIGGAMTLINQARAHDGMDPLDTPANINDAWDVLHFERGAITWLELRRFWDLRRWFEAGSGAPEYHSFLEGRDTCIPISEEERRTNPNL